MRHKLFLYFLIGILSINVFVLIAGNLVSTSGEIKLLVNENIEVGKLNQTGFRVGTESFSTNLHIQGNSIISKDMIIGSDSSTSNSNLHITGTMGFSTETVSSNVSLGESSYYLIDSSSGDLSLSMIEPSSATGRNINIKKISSSYEVTISGNEYIDSSESYKMTTSANAEFPHMNLVSDGSRWYIINASEGVEAVSATFVAAGNLLGYWTMDDTSGVQITDESGNNRHLTANNFDTSNRTTTGIVGNAINLSDGEYGEIAYDASWMNPSYGGTLSVWLYVEAFDQSTQQLIHRSDSGGRWRVERVGTSSDLRFKNHSLYSPKDANMLDTNWNHYVWSLNNSSSGNSFLMKDGVVINTTTEANRPHVSTTNLFFGETTGSQNIILDDIRFYDYGLTEEEALQIYTNTSP